MEAYRNVRGSCDAYGALSYVTFEFRGATITLDLDAAARVWRVALNWRATDATVDADDGETPEQLAARVLRSLA